MYWHFPPPSIPLLIAAISTAILAYRGFGREKSPIERNFALLMVGVTIWSVGYGLELASADLTTKILWAKTQYLGIVLIPAFWLVFTSRYTGRDSWISSPVLALLSIEPLIILVLVWTNDQHNLIWEQLRLETNSTYSILDYTYGVGFWFNALYSYLILGICTFLLVQFFFQSPRLYRRQTGTVLIGAFAPWLGNAIYLLGLSPNPNLDLTPMAFTITGLAVGWALYRYQFLDILPVARKAVIKGMNAGVMVLDDNNRIVYINTFAARSIGQSSSAIIGRKLDQVITKVPDLVERYRHVEEAQTEISIVEGEMEMHYDLSITPLRDHRDHLQGRLVIFHDTSNHKRIENALRESENRFRALFEQSPDAVLLMDTSQFPKIIDANTAACNLYQYTRSEIIGNPISRLDHPQELAKIPERRARILKETKASFESKHLRKDGALLSIEVQASLIEIDGEAYILSTHHDITEHKNTEQTLRRRAEELAVLNETLLDITARHDLEELLEIIVERAVNLLGANGGGLYLCDPARREVRCVVSYNTPRDYRGVVHEYGKGAAGVVAQTREPLIIDDYRKWIDQAEAYEEEQPFSAALSVPMRWQNDVIGVIHVLHDNQTHRFTQNDLEMLTLLANQAAIGVENARLLETERLRKRELETLRQASLEVTSSLEPQSVFDSILHHTLQLVSADDAHIFIYDGERLSFVAAQWSEGRREEPYAEPRQNGITYQVARSGERIIVPDMQNDPIFDNVNWEGAIIGLPLLIGTEVRGVMNVAYSNPHNFSQDEIRLLELLADQAAIAINNARLFDSEAKRRKEEERARRTTSALLDVSETIGSTMDLQEVLDAIVLAAREHLQVDRVAIFLRDPSDGSFVPSLPGKESSLTLQLDKDQISQFSSIRLNPIKYPLLQKLEQTRRTVYLKDLPSNDILPHDLIDTFNIRSLMVSPIIIQNQLSGLLYVDCTKENRTFSQEEITLATGLARQGALALERASLYESAHSRAQELDALHSATTALLTTINLESLLNQIIAAAIQAIPDADKGLLLLKNPSNGEFQARAKFGYSDQDLRGSLPIDQKHIIQATRDRTPVILPEPKDNNDIMNSMGTSELLKIKSAILTPLHFDDRAFGVLSLEAKKARIFNKSDLHVLVSFAATASAALRNAQLHAEVQKLALTDSLTGVYNRRGLFELGPREVERARRFKRPLSTILFDLDLFKEVNDRFGHTIGDQLLRRLVQRCEKHIREVDILARYGGEEFVILLLETTASSALQIAERLRRAVEKEPFMTDFGAIPITISLGVAELSSQIPDFSALIERADDAMYDAKKSGRNRVSVLDDDL